MNEPSRTGRRFFVLGTVFGIALSLGAIFISLHIAGETPLTAPGVDFSVSKAEWHDFPENSDQITSPTAPIFPNQAEEPPRVRNLILVIGDGVGIGSVSTGSYLLHGRFGGLALETAPHTALVRTTAADTLATDSAASGTSLATGHKVNEEVIGILPNGQMTRSWFDCAAAQGKLTGVVTTSGLFDATPASFTSHAPHRERYGTILNGMIRSRASLLVGGDWYLEAQASIDHDKAIALEALSRAPDFDWRVVRTQDDLFAAADGKVLALLAEREEQPEAYGPPLHVTSQWALDRLSAGPNGFVLLIECEIPDEAAHDLNLPGLVAGIHELDEAVAVAVGFAEGREDTLVVVTADHDTASPGIVESTEGSALVRWRDDEHSAQWVPLFAFGQGSDHFRGVLENTEVATMIADLLGLENFPALLPSVEAHVELND
ncbi:MAG: alkaline phosphatase [bacterium]|nr:alkaline phosphatase [bacterium]